MWRHPDSHTELVTYQLSASFFVFSFLPFFLSLEMSLFPSILHHYRFLFLWRVRGLDIVHPFVPKDSINQSINQSICCLKTKSVVVVVERKIVVSHIQRIGCQPEKNYFTRWPNPLVVCWTGERKKKVWQPPPPPARAARSEKNKKIKKITRRIHMYV